MVRSEERLHAGVRTDEVGGARLRMYVTTETVTRTVPVTREDLVIDREPLTPRTPHSSRAWRRSVDRPVRWASTPIEW